METAIVDSSKVWTVEDYLQLDEGLLAQLIDGKLIMSPAPKVIHQRLVGKLFVILNKLAEGETFISPIDLYLDKGNIFQPDLVFVNQQSKSIVTDRGIEGTPDLIVEVISPSNAFLDRNTKKTKYLESGVKEYWIVDPGNKTLEIYTPQDHLIPKLYLSDSGKVQSAISADIHFDLSQLFGSV